MRKYFSRNYVIPSPKLNEGQKKGLRRKLKRFFSKIRRRQKKSSMQKLEVFLFPVIWWKPKIRSSPQLGLYSVGICGSYLCRLALFRLIIQRRSKKRVPPPASLLQFKYWLFATSKDFPISASLVHLNLFLS